MDLSNINVTFKNIATDYCVIDTETNQAGEIIEVAGIKYSEGEEVCRIYSLIKPKTNIDETWKFHKSKIKNSDVSNSPSIEEFLPTFLIFVGNSIIIEHSSCNLYDIPKINNAAKTIGLFFDNCYINTCTLAKSILTNLTNHKLDTLDKFFHIRDKEVHRAQSDAEDTHKVYQELIKIVQDKNLDLKELENTYIPRTACYTRYDDNCDIHYKQDSTSIFYHKTVVLTGDMYKSDISHTISKEIIANWINEIGGYCDYTAHTTKKTQLLVWGAYKSDINHKSGSVVKAEKYGGIKILKMKDFWEEINKTERLEG